MTRKTFTTLAATVISLPLVMTAIAAASYHVRNRNDHTLVSSGERREYLLYVPRRYDPARPAPLVISMHGAGGWPVQQRDLTEWNRLAEREGCIIVYPSGLDGKGPRVWRADVGKGLDKDVRFIADLIDEIGAHYNIDRDRIYANGFSNGGGMAFALSCTMPDRIAAVGMVGAAQTLPWSWCTNRRAVPMIAFHGTADPFARYEGGESWVAPEPFPAVPVWTTNWAHRNRCDPAAVETSAAPDVARREYRGCADDASVILYTLREGGHTWPGGQPLPEWFVGRTSNSIDATSVMWEFFRAHPLRRPARSR